MTIRREVALNILTKKRVKRGIFPKKTGYKQPLVQTKEMEKSIILYSAADINIKTITPLFCKSAAIRVF